MDYSFDEFVFKNREEAEKVLSDLSDVISKYGHATVSDLYDLIDHITSNFNDFIYGWTELPNVRIDEVKNGYSLVLPTPKLLD